MPLRRVLYAVLVVFVCATSAFAAGPSVPPAPPEELVVLGASSNPNAFVPLNGFYYFFATTDADGQELWRTDGTTDGTTLVKSIREGVVSGHEGQAPIIVANGTLYFAASDSGAPQLWKSDGTEAGTVKVANIDGSEITTIGSAGGTIYLLVRTYLSGYYGTGTVLWRSDGTEAGTVVVKTFTSWTPMRTAAVGNAWIFGGTSDQLWRTDGTAAGTYMLIDGLYADTMTVMGGAVYLTGNNYSRAGLWKTDGTIAGTVLVSAGPVSGPLVVSNGLLYFSKETALAATDGTAAGTIALHDFQGDYAHDGYRCWSQCGEIRSVTPYAGGVYVIAGVSSYSSTTTSPPTLPGVTDLWTSDGTVAGTTKSTALANDYTAGAHSFAIGSRLYFNSAAQGYGQELWTSDGTGAGTHLVKDISEGLSGAAGYSADPQQFFALGQTLFFVATDRIHGYELWKSDGTAANTTLVKNINPEGTITGRVYDAATNAPITSAMVAIKARNASGFFEQIRMFPVDADGFYKIDGLPTLTYYLSVTNSESYKDELYNDRPCFPCSQTVGEGVYVESPNTVSGIDFALTKGGKIKGHVSSKVTGAPIAGLRVQIGKVYGGTNTSAVTDANGDYETAVGIPDDSWIVFTDASVYSGMIYDNISCAAGCNPTTPFTAVTTSAGTTTSGIDFAVTPLGKITGKLTDAVTGEGLRGYTVYAYPRDREIGYTNGLATTTGADGTYTLTLRDGTYSLLAAGSGSYLWKFWPSTTCTTCTTHAGTAIVPVPGSTTTYDFTLQPRGGRVRGSVKAAATNTAVASVRVSLLNSTGGAVDDVYTASDGTFAFPPTIVSGTYYLRTEQAAGNLVSEIWDGVNGQPCNACGVTGGSKIVISGTTVVDNVNFLLDRFGTVTAKVYDENTLDPLYAYVILTDASGREMTEWTSSGQASFPSVYPGTYSMHVAIVYGGYVPTYYGGTFFCPGCPAAGGTPVVVAPGGDVTANFPLKEAGTITGTVRSAADTPLTGSVVAYSAATGEQVAYADVINGSYELRVTGSVIVKASVYGYATKAHNGAECPNCFDVPPLTVNAGQTLANVNFTLGAPAHITGTVVDPVGTLNTYVDLNFYDARGNLLPWTMTSYGTFDIAVGSGSYYLSSNATLSGGIGYNATTYKAQTCATFCKDKALAITVASGGTVSITHSITGVAKITGTVTNSTTNAGLAGIPVVVWDVTNSKVAATVSSVTGGAYTALVPIGKYVVYTNASGYTNKVWNNVPCSGACNPAAGQVFNARTTYPNVNFAIAPKAAVRDSYGDITGDGRSEIIWRGGTGLFTMWEMSGRTIANSQTITTLADANWKVLGFGDFDGDGDDDFFFRNSVNGGTAMWLMSGKTIVLNAPSTTVAEMKWQMHAIGDFNGDGKDELIWRHTGTGQVAMWEMNGVTLLNGNVFATVSDLNWEILLAADFNGDGKDELLWRNKNTGALAMWDLNGRTPTNTNVFATVSDLTWNIVAAGDYNGDGKADLLWRQSTTNMIAMWEMNYRSLVDGRSLITVPAEWQVEHCGDFNGDRKDEILWRNGTTGAVAMWETNGHTLINTATFATVGDLNTKMQPRGGIRPALNSQ